MINEYALHNLFVRALFVRPSSEELKTHRAEFTIVFAPDQLSADLEALARGIEDRKVGSLVRRIFSIDLKRDELSRFENMTPVIQVARAAPAVSIPYAPRPWGKSCKKL